MDDRQLIAHQREVEVTARDLDGPRACALGLCCLERLVPVYERCCDSLHDKTPLRLRACLDRAWEAVTEDEVGPGAFQRPTAMEEVEEVDENPLVRALDLVEACVGAFLRAMQATRWERAHAVAAAAFELVGLLPEDPGRLAVLADAECRRQRTELKVLAAAEVDWLALREDAARGDLFGGDWFE